MKFRTVFLMIVLLMSTSLFAQEFKGKAFIAPSASFSYQTSKIKYADNTTKGDPVISLDLVLPGGVYLSNKLAFGGYLGYAYASEESSYYDNDGQLIKYDNKSNLYSVGLLLRNNFPLGERVNFLIDYNAGVSFGNFHDESEYGDFDLRTTYYSLNASPGINFKINESIYLESFVGSLYYDKVVYKRKDAGDDAPKTMTSNFGLDYNSISFGIMILL